MASVPTTTPPLAGNAITEGCTRSSDQTALNVLPFALEAVYRFDVLTRWRIPIVPYLKGGVAYYLWWIESGSGRVNDGVTTIVIGANDYAGAWAVDQRGRGLNPVTPGAETQREMSFRVGVNLVMHALTGNYKDDQVHIQDIMQRLRR